MLGKQRERVSPYNCCGRGSSELLCALSTMMSSDHSQPNTNTVSDSETALKGTFCQQTDLNRDLIRTGVVGVNIYAQIFMSYSFPIYQD